MISNKFDNESHSSDVLASIIGSNLIGVNRDPPRRPNHALSQEERAELRLHKARVFNSDTYYYSKIKAPNYEKSQQISLMNPNYNKLFNSQLLDYEFKNQTQYFLKNDNIEGYIINKKMIKNYKEGELKKDLFHREVKISKWF